MISLVASDLDGTLLRPDVTISERTRKAIHRVRQAGITFVAVTGRPPRSVRELADHIGLDGITICANGALVDDLAARARAVAGDEAVITWSARELVEVSAAGVTKASALERVCARLGVGRGQVLAIGDNENDLPMLRWAGRSAAVANASGNVLAMVDEVTASNLDDGVALLLERLVEERGGPRR